MKIIFDNKEARLVAINDVTEKNIAEESLKEAENKYKNTLDHMREGFQIISYDWKYLYINDSASQQGHSTKEELIGYTMMEKYPGIENTEMFSQLKKAMSDRVTISIENEFVYADGTSCWFHLNIEPVPEGIIVLSTDITKDKKAQNEISRLNRVYAVLSNINQSIVRIKNKQMLLETACSIAINDGKFKMVWFGLINGNDNIFIKTASFAQGERFINDVYQSREQYPFWIKDSARIILSGNYVIFNDLLQETEKNTTLKEYFLNSRYHSNAIFPIVAFNQVIGIFSLFSDEKNFFEEKEIALLQEMVQDISFAFETMEIEKKKIQAETELKASEERFHNAFEYASIGMALVSPEGNFLRVNKALSEILGYSKKELLSRNIREITHPDDVESDLKQIELMVSNKINTYLREKRYIHKSGRDIWILLNASILRDNEGHPLYFISQIQDITTRKEAEKEIIIAKEKAEEMNRLKNNFLANMSHELRTPMIGILGAAELFKNADSLEEVQDFLSAFETSAKRLMRTLNQILDISKIETENITLQKKNLIIDETVERVASLFKPEANAKKLLFNLIVHEKGMVVSLDEDIFVHIMNNLINNAIKFTGKGGVVIEIDKKNSEGIEFAEIVVRDTGAGIPKDKLNIIFEAFRQASEGFSRHHEGTGLGLTLSKKYTELLDGKISVESEQGKGSSFILHFPLVTENKSFIRNDEALSSATKGITIDNETPSCKVCYIDDDIVAHKFINKFLAGICVMDDCFTGEDGIRLVTNNKYDLILIDINLGFGMSGIDVANEIRKTGKYESIPLVAITGYAMPGDKEKFLSNGFNYYIPKPFNRIELREIITNIINENYSKLNK